MAEGTHGPNRGTYSVEELFKTNHKPKQKINKLRWEEEKMTQEMELKVCIFINNYLFYSPHKERD